LTEQGSRRMASNNKRRSGSTMAENVFICGYT
jgi:hypothetical protein